jgi:hypothetical protein
MGSAGNQSPVTSGPAQVIGGVHVELKFGVVEQKRNVSPLPSTHDPIDPNDPTAADAREGFRPGEGSRTSRPTQPFGKQADTSRTLSSDALDERREARWCDKREIRGDRHETREALGEFPHILRITTSGCFDYPPTGV